MTVWQLVFIALLIVSFAAFAWTLRNLTRVLMEGRPTPEPFKDWKSRFGDIFDFFFLQKSVAREKSSRHHLAIFWGFLIITIGTLEILVNGVFPSLSLDIFGNLANSIFKGVLDITNAIVLATIGYSFYRRIFRQPQLIPMNWDAGIILGMIAALCVTHFFSHGLHFVAMQGGSAHAGFGPEGNAAAMPVSAALAAIFRSTPPATAHLISAVSYWTHVLIILFFLNYIPYSKHIHLLGAFPNILLRNRGVRGALPKIDLEDENQWGVGRYEAFNVKSLLDSYACTECARCSNACPAMATDKPLSPMHLVLDIREEMQSRGALLTRLSDTAKEALTLSDGVDESGFSTRDKHTLEKIRALPPLVGGRIKEETLWSCTTCGACETECPVFIEHPLKIMQMRTHLVLEKGEQPAELARMFRGIENNQNPWGIGADKRMDWAADISIPTMAEKGGAEYLVWIGCSGCYDDNGKKISRDWIALLQQAGVDFAVLGDEEGCTGDSARRAGNEFLFQMMAEANIETFKKYDIKKILVSCPHCLHSFRNEYGRFGGHYEVTHHSEFLEKLVAEGRLNPSDPDSSGAKENKTASSTPEPIGQIVYHDPCYLGRWNNEYEKPRALLAAANGGNAPGEMPRNQEKSFCCGAGGARFWVEEENPRVNIERTQEAVDTGADIIATACPFCNVMLNDGLKSINKDEDVKVFDVAQILARSTGAQPLRDEAPPADVT